MFDEGVVLLDAAMGKDLKMRGVEIPGTIWAANALGGWYGRSGLRFRMYLNC